LLPRRSSVSHIVVLWATGTFERKSQCRVVLVGTFGFVHVLILHVIGSPQQTATPQQPGSQRSARASRFVTLGCTGRSLPLVHKRCVPRSTVTASGLGWRAVVRYTDIIPSPLCLGGPISFPKGSANLPGFLLFRRQPLWTFHQFVQTGSELCPSPSY
jgi:hypothetical protein